MDQSRLQRVCRAGCLLRRGGTVSDYKVETEDGSLLATVLPSEGYDLAWIPAADLLLPFSVEKDESLRTSLDISMDLDFGVPLYGAILDAEVQVHGDVQ